MGGLQLIDYAMLKHADGEWLSNFDGISGEKTDLRVRQMAWWRSPAIPATALVIGNPEMQDKGWEFHIQSLAGALPIMLGDPRKLSIPDLKKYRTYADWLQLMENKHSIMSFRQDLLGFGEPTEGRWDGFQRVNTETKSGGILGIFKQGSRDAERQVFVSYLHSAKHYQIKDALTGKVIVKATGSDLSSKGFKVVIPEAYGGRLFEVVQQ
jgi:alpha-galactosidase